MASSTASAAANMATDAADGAVDIAKDTGSFVADKVSEGAGMAVDAGSAVMDTAGDVMETVVDEVSDFLRHHKVIGFNTYGEQFDGMHINQTFTGVVIGQPDAGYGHN